jgi:hypothetical protein
MRITREWFEAWADRHGFAHNLEAHIHPWEGGQDGAIYLSIYLNGGDPLALFWNSPEKASIVWNVETGEKVRPEG